MKAWHEHSAEIMSIDWNNLVKDQFVTASWDHTYLKAQFRQWTLGRTTSLLTLPAHSAQIYNATWNPSSPTVLLTCASDGFLKVFDTRNPQPDRPVHAIQASPTEMLSCDWNKYDSAVVATAGKDMSIRIWDLRGAAGKGVGELRGHSLAVRKVQ